MKAIAKSIYWLLIWLFAVTWCSFHFTASEYIALPNQLAFISTEKYLESNSWHNESPVEFPYFDPSQTYLQNLKAEEKGKAPSKYLSSSALFNVSAIPVAVTSVGYFRYPCFFKYLFILYCVLLI